MDRDSQVTWTGAFAYGTTYNMGQRAYDGGAFEVVTTFSAHNSNAIYTDNGLILPKSISKQSYIIYK